MRRKGRAASGAGRWPAPAVFATAWVGGSAAAFAGPALCPWAALAASVAATLIIYAVLRRPWVLVLAVALLAALWSTFSAGREFASRLPRALEGRTLVVTGRIADLPRSEPGRVRFQVNVNHVEDVHGATLPRVPRIALSWYRPPPRTPRVGERWRFRVRLMRPRGLADPGAFDYARWAFAHDLGATGYVYRNAAVRLAPARPGLGTVRARVVHAVHRALPDSPWAGLVAGLAVGARGGVTDAQWQTLRKTGTSHLLAISGLHLGLVAALAFLVVAGMARRVPALVARVPARLVGAGAAALAALLYAALAGFSLPTQRALVMIALPLLALAMRRRVGVATALGIAAFTVTLLSPRAVVTAGFWLSFGAVAALAWGLNAGRRGRSLVRAQLVVSVALVPLVALFFGQVSLVGPAANLVAIPVVGWLAVPPALAGAIASLLHPGWGAPLFSLSAAVLAHLWPVLQWLAHRGLASLPVAPAGWLALGAAVAGAACLFAPRGLGLGAAGMALLVPLVRPAVAPPRPGDFRVTVLDVGQGLAAAVRTAHHLVLIDSGPRWWGGNDAGRAVVLPFLHSRHLGAPDLLVLSHIDADHAGGLRSLRRAYPALPVLSGAAQAARGCRRGEHWRWDGVEFRVLGPEGRQPGSRNNRSCILKVTGAGGSVLFPGDIERPAERSLLASARAHLRSDVLVAPHHGSATSSTPAFVAAVAPRYVVFTVGYRNRYRFPRPRVVMRYRRAGAQLLDSAHDGAVTFQVTRGGGVALVERYRPTHRRPWTDP